MKYIVLDQTTQATLTRNRLRDLENQHKQLSLRIKAPAPGDPVTDADNSNLQALEDSIKGLQEDLGALEK